jgi:hypothetical protein
MTDKLKLKSSHEVVYTVYVADVESIFYCKPDDPDILTVLMKDGKRLYCDEVCPIDSLQEEPVSEELGEYINELSKQFPEVSFAKLSRIAVRVSRWQRNQDVKNKLPKVISKTDLDEYAYQCAYDMSNDWAIDNPTWHDVEDACKLGANWQKQQDQSTELAEDHAMLAGMEKMKEEMMANGVDGVVHHFEKCGVASVHYSDPTGVPMSYFMSSKGFLAGDKVKVIVIKEG